MVELRVIDLGLNPEPPRKKILVVDDESAMHSVIFDTLSDDYQLAAAHNGKDGIEKAIQFKPDLILMDLMMPDIGGYEAVRLLRGNLDTRAIPVIVVTARTFDPSTIEMLKHESNVAAFINKPFRPKELREVVKQALS